jgi:hypothetical protein
MVIDFEFQGEKEEWHAYCWDVVKALRDFVQVRTILLSHRPELEFNIVSLEGTCLETEKIHRFKGKHRIGKFPKRETTLAWVSE